MKYWIKTSDTLPPAGKYVLARHSRGTWRSSTNQDNVNCVVVRLVKGISIAEREALKEAGDLRWRISCSNDEGGNNLRPYSWDTFGPDEFYGQDIYEWMHIPPSDKVGPGRPRRDDIKDAAEVNAVFPTVISLIEEGLDITEAIKLSGIPAMVFYKHATGEHRYELHMAKTANTQYGVGSYFGLIKKKK